MSETDKEVLRKYYAENDFLLSPEGILKVISVVVSVVSGSLWLTSACPSGRSAGAASSGAAAAGALTITAACVLKLATKAPYYWFYMDMVVCCVSGVVLLLATVFSFTICDLSSPLDYVYGPISLLAATVTTSSAVLTYVTVSGRWEHTAAAQVRVSTRDIAPVEMDV